MQKRNNKVKEYDSWDVLFKTRMARGQTACLNLLFITCDYYSSMFFNFKPKIMCMVIMHAGSMDVKSICLVMQWTVAWCMTV